MPVGRVDHARMKKHAMPTLILALMWVPAFAGPQGAAAFSSDRLRAHVEFLADDLLEGREAGTRGYDIAARYVAASSRRRASSPRAKPAPGSST